MATKKKSTKAIVKKTVEKTKAVVSTKESDRRKAVWLGAQSLIQRPQAGSKEEKAFQLQLLAARAAQVSPFGVNILGDLPYLNKIGLGQKADQYAKNVSYKYNWIKYANDDTEKAIVGCKVLDGTKELTDWVIGECSPSSMKMGTLKGYQNHMAQTRAKNRAIQEAFGRRIHTDMIEQIQLLVKGGVASDKQAALIGGAAVSSAEEIQTGESREQTDAREHERMEVEADIMGIIGNAGCKVGQEKAFIEKTLGRSVKVGDMTIAELKKLRTELNAKLTK